MKPSNYVVVTVEAGSSTWVEDLHYRLLSVHVGAGTMSLHSSIAGLVNITNSVEN